MQFTVSPHDPVYGSFRDAPPQAPPSPLLQTVLAPSGAVFVSGPPAPLACAG